MVLHKRFLVLLMLLLSMVGVQQLPRAVAASTDVLSSNLSKAFEVGTKVGNPYELQAIMLVESKGGMHPSLVNNPKAPIALQSVGLMQVQVATARSMMTRFFPSIREEYFPGRTKISDSEIKKLLLTNHEANITIAAYVFKLYLEMCNGNKQKAIVAYNVGIGGVQKIKNYSKFPYARKVNAAMVNTVNPFNYERKVQELASRF